MSTTGKISPKKVKRFIGMTVLLIAFTGILIAADGKQSDAQIEGVIVTLKHNGREEDFLKKDDVESMIAQQGVNVQDETLSSIDVDAIESIVRSNPWVMNAEVYVDNNAKVNIEVVQRSPVARIFDASGNSFYLDKDGFEMPLSDRYAYSVPVFTNYRERANDSINTSFRKAIVYLSSMIKEDTFWNAQITQVDIAGLNDFNFYTTLGKQKVKFGDTALALQKLDNLMAFYNEVSNKIGWDRYEVLDVRFKGQVVASPSIGWIPPKDTVALAVMPWHNNDPNASIKPTSPRPAVVTEKKAEPEKKIIVNKEGSEKNDKNAPSKKIISKKEGPDNTAARPKQDPAKQTAKKKATDKQKDNKK